MREPTIFPRALVYLGGMGAIRWFGRLAFTLCVGCAVTFLWSRLAFGCCSVVLVGLTYGSAVLLTVGSRLAVLHSVVVTSRGWVLLPLVGPAKFMAPVTVVYEQGDDVVVLGIDGRTTVLGVDRFPSRSTTAVRRSLVEALRQSAAFY